jgi:Ca-activated chloride channel family protein
MRTLITIVVLAFTALTGFAQQATQPSRPAQPPRGPVLTEEDGSPVKGVHLARVDVRAVVRGSLAEATMTLTFANTENRVLGGELVFPLPEGATVTGYGLEINGVMVDGVAVEKQQARVIYEKELHKRVDPGLVEQAAGNSFRTRLYPVPANGTRSIKVQYVTDASATKDGLAVTLPMGWGGNVDRCTVRIDAPDATAQPAIASVKGNWLSFKQVEHGYSAEGELKDAPDEMVVVLPGLAERSVSIEKRVRPTATIEDLEEQAKGGEAAKSFERFEHFFVINDTPPAPAADDVSPRAMRRVAILWDAGLSRSDVDKSRELKLLAALLKQWPEAYADLVIFRDQIERPVPFDLHNADGRGEIIERLSHLVYDGASDLGDLPLPKNLGQFPGVVLKDSAPDYGCILLFTGGIAGVGPETMRKSEVPVYAFSDEARANHAMLRQVCRESGGQYFNLKRLTDEQVMSAVGREAYSLMSIDSKPGEVAEVYPGPGTPVGGRVALSGKLLAPEATITVNYGFGKRITHSQSFTLKATDATQGDLIPRYWAQQKLAELAMQPGVNDEELAKIGKQFNLVTPNTSLLVLETADQYVQYRVVPPKDRPEIYKEFLAKIEQNKAQERQTKEEKIQQVLAMWDGRVKWWEQKFEYPKDFKFQQPAEKSVSEVIAGIPPGQGPVFGAAHRPIPAASPPPAAVASPAPAPTPTPQGAQGLGGGETRYPNVATNQPALPAASPQAPAAQGGPGAFFRNQLAGQSGAGGGPAASQPFVYISAGADGAFGTADDIIGVSSGKAVFAEPGGGPAIAITPWDPATPYLAAMKAVPADKAYGVFLDQRKTFGTSPAFYLDCGDYLERVGQHELAVRVLTDVAALKLAEARLLRVAAHRLQQIGEREIAIDLFEKVLKMRPEEPQSHRDLALALADRADACADLPPDSSNRDTGRMASDYARALELFNQVLVGRWDRFQEIELPCLMEANRINAKVSRLKQAGAIADVPVPLDPRFVKNLECDLRVVMTWDADNTDIDLWVTEPSGEKCLYSHNRTTIGGMLSRDFTDGYGPEEYCLRRLMAGKYAIQANFYGSRQQELSGPCTVQATVYTDFGRPTEKKQSLTLRLVEAKEVVDIGSVELGGKAGDNRVTR